MKTKEESSNHIGDPCVKCGTPHDEVSIGPCKEKPIWSRAENISNNPSVHSALSVFSEDSSGDNGTGVILAVLEVIDSSSTQSDNVKEMWPYLQHKEGCRPRSFTGSIISYAPMGQRTCTCGLDQLRNRLIKL